MTSCIKSSKRGVRPVKGQQPQDAKLQFAIDAQSVLRESNERLEQRLQESDQMIAKLKKTEHTLRQYILRQKKTTAELNKLAHIDLLTQLPNRTYFHEQLNKLIKKSNRTKKEFALLYIDIDNFKNINDTLGHAIGDNVLKQVTAKVKKTMRDVDFIARIGGDEFVILTEDVGKHEDIALIASRIITEFTGSLFTNQHEINTSVSIGIAVYNPGESDASLLMEHADIAMYFSKDSGKNTYHFFSDKLNKKHKSTEEDLHAIDTNELTLV